MSNSDTAPSIYPAPAPLVKVVAHHPHLVVTVEGTIVDRDCNWNPVAVCYITFEELTTAV